MRTITRDIVGAFIFSRDGKLLMGKSHKGGVYSKSWIIPGGGVEDGETKIEALRREILEETGIDIKSSEVSKIEGALRGQSEKNLRDTGERVLVNMNFYNYKVIIDKDSSDITLKTDDDFIEARWFSQPELSSVQMSPPSLETLKKLGYL
jgi:8-oxo-dGTP diphosphatase